MSVTQILEEVKSFSDVQIESLETSLRLEKLRRAGVVAGVEETQLLALINAPLPQNSRYQQLRNALADGNLSGQEHAELLQISDQREKEWAQKLEGVARLATLRGENFDALYEKLGLQHTSGVGS